MAKFTPREMKKSLREGLSLMDRGDKFIWVQYHEIESAYQQGFTLVNSEKRKYFERRNGGHHVG